MTSMRRQWVGLALLGTWGVLYLGLGGVLPEAQLAAHAAVAGCLGLCLLLPAPRQALADRLTPAWIGLGLVLAAIAVGLVPLPGAVLAWVAPGVLDAHGPVSWHTLSVSPERTADRLALWTMYLGMATAAGVWATRRRAAHQVGRIGLLWFLGVLGFALAHAASSTHAVLGFVPTSLGHHRTFFAPFVDDTHLGTLLLLLLPNAVRTVARSTSPVARPAVVLLLVVVSGVLLQIGSKGATGVALVLGAVALGWPRERRPVAAVVGLLALPVVAAALVWRGGLGGIARLEAWRDALPILVSFPLAGTGHGGFATTFAAYRTNLDFLRWAHLHNDGLQWVVEGGLLGAGLGVVALGFLLPAAVRTSAFARPWLLGLLGVATHSLVEFPFHIPSIAASVAIVLGMLHGRASRGQRLPVGSATRARWVLATLLALQLAGGLWTARSLAQVEAVHQVGLYRYDPITAEEGARRLRWIAPWRSELALLDLWKAESAGDSQAAVAQAHALADRYRADDDALRRAGISLFRSGEHAAAEQVLNQAIARNPADWRSPAVLARLHERMGTGDRVADWEIVIRRGAPPEYLRDAWRVRPDGAAWLPAVADGLHPARASAAWGSLLEKNGDPEGGLLAYEQAARLQPTSGHATSRTLIRLLTRAGRLEEALERAALGVERSSDPGAYLVIQAGLQYDLGDPETAFATYQRALPLNPQAAGPYLQRAAETHGVDDAHRRYRAITLSAGPNPWAALAVAAAFADSGEHARCRQLLRQVERDRGASDPLPAQSALSARCDPDGDGPTSY